jgi:tetratricopeptide (TPR) repeat protein
MPPRLALLAPVAVLLAGAALRAQPPDKPAPAVQQTDPMPLPPIPPRIAQGPDYASCLDMLDADPQGASAFADTWAASGGLDGAIHCKALARIALGDAEAGARMLARLAASSSAPELARAAIYGQAVQAWLMADRPRQAFDAATQALALKPDDADLLTNRAVAAGELALHQAAIADLNRVLTVDPRRVEALVLRGSAWRRLSQFAPARADIDRALAIDPDNVEALLERGVLGQHAGDTAAARADWQRAISLDPDSSAADLARQNLALLEVGPSE